MRVLDKRMSQTRTKYITLIPKANGDTIQRVNYYLHTERFYGDFVKIDNSRWRVYHPTGHVDITSQGVQTWMYYVRDRLGSTRAVITEQGVPLQATDYYPSGIPVETYTAGNAYNTTDRLHTGKEFHPFDGLSWHDNAARFHDTLFPRFTTVDPLAEKYPGVSPYVFCNNNPLIFLDLDGEKPSESEAAAMSSFVYSPNDKTLPGGWEFQVLHENNTSGLKLALFSRSSSGKIEFTIAFAGTEDIKDFISDVAQLFGASSQHSEATNIAIGLSSNFSNFEMTFVGHSLGGGLAAASAYATGRDAMTFNAAGLSPATIASLGLTKVAKVDAFVNYRDELTLLSLTLRLPVADRKIHVRFDENLGSGHSISNFTDKSSFKDKVINFLNNLSEYINPINHIPY